VPLLFKLTIVGTALSQTPAVVKHAHQLPCVSYTWSDLLSVHGSYKMPVITVRFVQLTKKLLEQFVPLYHLYINIVSCPESNALPVHVIIVFSFCGELFVSVVLVGAAFVRVPVAVAQLLRAPLKSLIL